MSASVNELHVMDVWVFRLAQSTQARALYDRLPATLKGGAELRCGITGAELRTPLDEAAAWLRDHLNEA